MGDILVRHDLDILDSCTYKGVAVAACVVRTDGDVRSACEQDYLVGQAALGLGYPDRRDTVDVIRRPSVQKHIVAMMLRGI